VVHVEIIQHARQGQKRGKGGGAAAVYRHKRGDKEAVRIVERYDLQSGALGSQRDEGRAKHLDDLRDDIFVAQIYCLGLAGGAAGVGYEGGPGH